MSFKLSAQKPSIVRGRVTQEHIDQGTPRRATQCPLSVSIGESIGVPHGYIHVDAKGVKITRKKDYREQAFLTEKMARFLIAFDAGEKVEPFSWTLHFFDTYPVAKPASPERKEKIKKMREAGLWSRGHSKKRSRTVGLASLLKKKVA